MDPFLLCNHEIFSPIAAPASIRRQSDGCGPLAVVAVARCEPSRPLSKTDRRLLLEILDAPLPALPPADQVFPQSTFRLFPRHLQGRDIPQ